MNAHLQNVLNLIQQSPSLSDEDKISLSKALKDADKQLETTAMTEKVKRTTVILLEEAIEELEQKRKTVAAQNRELEIEAALEKVRARTMTMHQSDELSDVVKLLYLEFDKLKINNESTDIEIGIIDEQTGIADIWAHFYLSDGTISKFKLPLNHFPLIRDEFTKWRATPAEKRKELFFTSEFSRDIWNEFIELINELPELVEIFRPLMEAKITQWVTHNAYFSHGILTLQGTEHYSPETLEIQKRFAKVFEQTYTRFLDLQKAEAQAREAQIEAALERVRSKAMAMYKSDDLKLAVETVFEELDKLNLGLIRCGIAILDKEKPRGDIWITIKSDQGSTIQVSGDEPLDIHPLLHNAYDAWLKQEDFSYVLEKEDLHSYYEAIKQTDFQLPISKTLIEEKQDQRQYYFNAVFKHGSLFAFLNTAFTDEAIRVMKRFANVFNLTYKRFLDLQKAEAQARESQIQLAMERVRARTMAMQRSDELAEVATVLFQQVKALGVPQWVCGFSIWEIGDKEFTWYPGSPDGDILAPCKIPLTEHPVFISFDESKRRGDELFVYEKEGEFQADHYRYMMSVPGLRDLMQKMLDAGLSFPSFQVDHLANFSHGNLIFITYKHFPEMHDIFKRFAKVFEQTYTRFLDLQKAEAQAREAQIELGLERVRARAMAMQTSDELSELVAILFEELIKLDLILARCIIWIFNNDTLTARMWMANSEDKRIAKSYHIKRLHHPYYEAIINGWKEKNSKWVYDLKGDDKKTIDALLLDETELSQLPEAVKNGILNSEETFVAGSFNNFGLIEASGPAKPTDEQLDILNRFGKVFDLSYTRFNDLKQAEAQAGEARIEAGLERVRSRAMAMQSSEELNALIGTVFSELTKLDLILTRSVILIYEGNEKGCRWWMANSEAPSLPANFFVKYTDLPFFNEYFQGWQDNSVKWQYILEGENKVKTDDFLFGETELSRLPDFVIAGMKAPNKVYLNASFNNFGNLTLASLEPLSDEHFDILLRFAKVFELTYTRFNDLKQAEAQAREAQIEASLERVRTRTMAMHTSEDVGEATATMFIELKRLNIQNFRGGILTIKSDQTMDVWSANTLDDGRIMNAAGGFDMTMHPFWRQLYTGWKNEIDSAYFNMAGKAREDYVNILNARHDYLPNGIQLPDCHVQSYFFGEGAVWTFSLSPHTEEQKKIMKRFAAVFSLTFRRYQDLKKAEAQAREATIEAALERVRGKAMAMHNSQDLAATIGVFYRELEAFSITARRCGVGLLNKGTRIAELSTMNTTEPGDTSEIIGTLKMQGHPVLEGVYDNWLLQKEYHPVLRGNEIKEYYQLLRPQIAFPDYPNDEVQYGYFFFFSEGGVYAWTKNEMNEDELQIYRRFTTVLSLTYKRYMDLKQAEANATEAVKQAALDRIRAEIASMRTVSDLDRITPLIWNELNILAIPFIRCGVFIMDEAQQLIHTFLSTPDGKAIAAFHLPYHTSAHIDKVLRHWQQKDIYVDHWGKEAFIDLAHLLVKQGAIASTEQYLHTIPREGFYLHFLPFLQGMLYVGNTTELGAETIKLLQSVADAFSTAYARYEDFNNLEIAKRQMERTLTDLRQAQQQLIQSEKMASLGELTAGIAHEIQNPLNFVNNFSDVSTELLEEMASELSKGNVSDAINISEDVRQNLQKILYHGKRADAIVKGMLQHSRTSSGQKEPTDINALADEYLRLAYHGLRAKDKSFNAKFETNFDHTVEKINVVPQEIGRVILNLVNNAFYAVIERKKQAVAGYEPVVTITTGKEKGKTVLRVRDNGTGIPHKILDKIFQPFFTTKPTGQGTGLGLSICFDIVKANGGEIRFESKEEVGTEFIMSLPA